MNITKNNYEAYILDYLEGQLSDEGKAELFRFLDAHPDLAAEFDVDLDGLPHSSNQASGTDFPELKAAPNEMPKLIDEKLAAALEGDSEFPISSGNVLLEKHWKAMQLTKIPVELVSIGSKDALKVAEAEDQQTWLAAVAEGDVADGPLKTAALNDAHLSNEIANLKKAVLVPETVKFGDLSVLKREPKVVPLFAPFVKYAAVAAAFIAAIAWFSLADNSAESSLYQAYNGGVNSSRAVVNTVEETDEQVQQESAYDVYFANQPAAKTETTARPKVNVSFAKQIQPKQIQLDYQTSGEIASIVGPSAANSGNAPAEIYTVSAQKTYQYVPIKEFVIGKAKSKVLGETQAQSEETFVRALTDKIEESIQERNSSKFQIQLPNKKKGQKFYFKLGKLEINQPSGVVELVHGSGNANR